MDDITNKPLPESNNGPQSLDYLIVLAKHSRMIIYTTVVVTVLTYLILLVLPNKYTSTARILPPQQNMTLSAQILSSLGGSLTPGTGGGGGGGAGMAASLLGLKSPGDLYVSLLTSNTVLDAIINQFSLRKLYKGKYLEDTRKKLLENVDIRAGQKDTIIFINVTDKDPKRAAEIAKTFIDELDRLLRRLAFQEAKARQVFLDKERSQAMDNLTKAEEELRNFKEKNSVLQIDAQTRAAIEYIAKFRGEIDAKEIQIQVLRQQATASNYDLIRLETELKGLKEKLRSAENQWENCIGDVCLPTSKAPSLGLEYFRLFRIAKFQESLYQLYVRLTEIARMDIARNSVTVVQVIDFPKPSEKRSNKRMLPTLCAGGLTFLLMIFTAFLIEYWQNIKNIVIQPRCATLLTKYLEPWSQLLQNVKSLLKIKPKTK